MGKWILRNLACFLTTHVCACKGFWWSQPVQEDRTSLMTLGTILVAGWLHSTSYQLVNKASRKHPTVSSIGRASGKWEGGRGRQWGPFRKWFCPLSRTVSKMDRLGQWDGGGIDRLESMPPCLQTCGVGTGKVKEGSSQVWDLTSWAWWDMQQAWQTHRITRKTNDLYSIWDQSFWILTVFLNLLKLWNLRTCWPNWICTWICTSVHS